MAVTEFIKALSGNMTVLILWSVKHHHLYKRYKVLLGNLLLLNLTSIRKICNFTVNTNHIKKKKKWNKAPADILVGL